MTKKIFFLLLVGLLVGSSAATATDSTAPIVGAPTATGTMNMQGATITNLGMVDSPGASTNKQYVDQRDAALLARISALESKVNSLQPTTSTINPTTPTTPTNSFQPMTPGSSAAFGYSEARISSETSVPPYTVPLTANDVQGLLGLKFRTTGDPACSGSFTVSALAEVTSYGGWPTSGLNAYSVTVNGQRVPNGTSVTYGPGIVIGATGSIAFAAEGEVLFSLLAKWGTNRDSAEISKRCFTR